MTKEERALKIKRDLEKKRKKYTSKKDEKNKGRRGNLSKVVVRK